MLQLPWHIERPLATALIVGIVSAFFVLFRSSYDMNFLRSRDSLAGYFRRRFGALGSERADSAARIFLVSMAIVFGCMSLFGFSVALGLVQNGERYVPPKSNESLLLQEYLDGKNGQIDIKQLIRQNEANREQK